MMSGSKETANHHPPLNDSVICACGFLEFNELGLCRINDQRARNLFSVLRFHKFPDHIAP